MDLIIASNNKGKIKEFEKLLDPSLFTFKSLSEVGFDKDIEETGSTLEENANIKAQAIWDQFKIPVISDDSGLFIDALNGAPGVYSARYAGEHKSDQDNIDKVLKNLRYENNKKAHFGCVLCLIINKEVHYFEGKVHGEIREEREGNGGFGYDPIFQPDGYGQTFGTLSSEVKNGISHRAMAMKKLVHFLEGTLEK
jgi:XTP/dITP diphosphohydrolase